MAICALLNMKDHGECQCELSIVSSTQCPRSSWASYVVIGGWQDNSFSLSTRGIKSFESIPLVPKHCSYHIGTWNLPGLINSFAHGSVITSQSGLLRWRVLTCQPTGYHVCSQSFEHWREGAHMLHEDQLLIANERGVYRSDLHAAFPWPFLDYSDHHGSFQLLGFHLKVVQNLLFSQIC